MASPWACISPIIATSVFIIVLFGQRQVAFLVVCARVSVASEECGSSLSLHRESYRKHRPALPSLAGAVLSQPTASAHSQTRALSRTGCALVRST